MDGSGEITAAIASWLREFGGPALLSCAGATVQCLRGPWRGWRNLLISNAAAAFGGVVCMLVLPHYVPADVAAGVAGIVGYSGGSLIDAVIDRVRRDLSGAGGGQGGAE